MTNDVEYFFIQLLAIAISSIVKSVQIFNPFLKVG